MWKPSQKSTVGQNADDLLFDLFIHLFICVFVCVYLYIHHMHEVPVETIKVIGYLECRLFAKTPSAPNH